MTTSPPPRANGLGRFIRQIQALTRWKEWATSKLPFLISCLLITQLQADSREEPADPLAIALLFLQLCLLAAYGYMVNSFYDVRSDGAAGKPNAFSHLRVGEGRTLLGCWLGAAASLGILQFASDGAVLLLLLACYGSSTAYSAPPLRLKERGALGLITASAAQRFLPVILIFQALGTWSPAALLLCLLNGLVGLRYILAHQIDDYQADLRSSTETLATSQGLASMRRLGRFLLFPLETLTLLIALLILQRDIPMLAWFLPAYLAILAGYLLLLPSHRLRVIDGSSYAPFSGLYNIFMPLYLAVLFAFSNHVDAVAGVTVAVCIALWLIPEVQEKVRILSGAP
ncbi:UbiA family prenyltransferase [Synechococcus sp. CBW1006]|uniref:UbiA family prenyltransferase n=1 Tax=Synechococcus sp. CBW1006 TaxID=1353138 RepID=UPI0018CD5AA2|nr:UbiA family prenyltransferase [Synechococcus sp. CBW1006]QPN67468.1 UbiA family prenyltransferase [Synechococcus sp. CBW1006]